jgi:hypothetical protein
MHCGMPNLSSSGFLHLPRLCGWTLAKLLVAAFLLAGCARRESTPGACRLPARSRQNVSRFVVSSPAYYVQRDKRWANEPIGGSGKPLAAVGCTVCCLSMALAQEGIDLNPAELNRALKRSDGYTSIGWLRWPALADVTDSRARAEILRKPTLRDIDAALAAGQPVIVKVAPPPMVQHWVLLVGREGREYLMKDPLDNARTVRPLSSLGSDILAVRIVKSGAG